MAEVRRSMIDLFPRTNRRLIGFAMPTIAILGTMDTKGVEHGFVADLIRQRGHRTLVIDVGALEVPALEPDIPREQVAREGGIDLPALLAKRDRGEMVAAMAGAAAILVERLARDGRIDGIISLGGGGGTTIGTTAMRALPIGFPKVMVSTLASGNTAPFVGLKDIVMVPSVVDVAGINRISRPIFARAAGAICGMVEMKVPAGQDKPLIVASMFGNTNDCVSIARKLLEDVGYEVLVFHATGTGGRSMESLIESGLIAGVLDITTTEWADELVGGILGAGPTRLEAAGKTGTPAIVAPGCIDMINFGPRDTVPAKFAGRKFYQHNPNVTLMRLTKEEAAQLGEMFAPSSMPTLVPSRCCFRKRASPSWANPADCFTIRSRTKPFSRRSNTNSKSPCRSWRWIAQ